MSYSQEQQSVTPSGPPFSFQEITFHFYVIDPGCFLCFMQTGKQKLQYLHDFLRIHILIKAVCKQKQMSFFHGSFSDAYKPQSKILTSTAIAEN